MADAGRTVHITCVTDCVDIAAYELQASLRAAANWDEQLVIEPVVPILPAFSAINGNFAVRLAAEIAPPGSVLLITMGPSKVRPRSLVGRCRDRDLLFVGRDTGVFDWLARDFGIAELRDASNAYGSGSDFVSFAGKYVTAPIAVAVARGADLSTLGEPAPVDSVTRLDLEDGTIVHVDNFGMMKFTGDIPEPEEGARYEVVHESTRLEATFARRMMSLDDGAWALFPGSSYGLYELGRVRSDGAGSIGAHVGDKLRIRRL